MLGIRYTDVLALWDLWAEEGEGDPPLAAVRDQVMVMAGSLRTYQDFRWVQTWTSGRRAFKMVLCGRR